MTPYRNEVHRDLRPPKAPRHRVWWAILTRRLLGRLEDRIVRRLAFHGYRMVPRRSSPVERSTEPRCAGCEAETRGYVPIGQADEDWL